MFRRFSSRNRSGKASFQQIIVTIPKVLQTLILLLLLEIASTNQVQPFRGCSGINSSSKIDPQQARPLFPPSGLFFGARPTTTHGRHGTSFLCSSSLWGGQQKKIFLLCEESMPHAIRKFLGKHRGRTASYDRRRNGHRSWRRLPRRGNTTTRCEKKSRRRRSGSAAKFFFFDTPPRHGSHIRFLLLSVRELSNVGLKFFLHANANDGSRCQNSTRLQKMQCEGKGWKWIMTRERARSFDANGRGRDATGVDNVCGRGVVYLRRTCTELGKSVVGDRSNIT